MQAPKYVLSIMLTIVCFVVSTSTYAKAILNIVPTSTTVRSITLAANGSTTLIYTVTNNVKVTVNNITIDPYYGINNNLLTLTVQNNNCTGNIAPGASCTFGLLIQGNGQTTNSIMMPRVCEFNGATCSVPILSNRISIKAGGTGASVAYVVNASGAGLVSICPINDVDGTLDTCSTSNGDGTFNAPFGISINAAGTAAYIANSGNNTVSICSIIQDGTGSIGNCTTSNGNGTFNYPIGISLNPSGNYLYVANNGTLIPTISICPIIQTGSSFSLGTCTTTTGNGTFGGGLGLQGISFNADGTYAYAPANTWVSICPALQDGSGNLGTCRKVTDATFIFPQGVSFNSSGTYAYIGNYIVGQHSGTVSVCPVLQDGSGGFGTCTSSNGNGTFDFFFNDEVTLWMSSPTNYGYIPNNGNNTVSICPINTITSNLDVCTTTSGNGTFNQPTAVALSYVISNP